MQLHTFILEQWLIIVPFCELVMKGQGDMNVNESKELKAVPVRMG